MRKILFPILFQLFLIVGLCQDKTPQRDKSPLRIQNNQPLLVKANTSSPAEDMKKVRLAYQKNKSKVVQAEERYSFEKRRGQTLAGRNFRGQVTNIKPEPKFEETPSQQISAVGKINLVTGDDGGPDPMVAVGEKTILVGNTGWIKFFDKATGQVLEETNATSLFWRYLSPTIPGTNQPNPEFASNFYNIPKDLPYYCSKSNPCHVERCEAGTSYDEKNLPCGETDTTIENAGLINEAYDLRVFYQKEHKRFVLIAALRNQSSKDNNCYNRDGSLDCSQYLIRLVAIAVSVSENPADGFHIYRTGENNYRDWPNASVDQDYLAIANKSGDSSSNGRSIVTVFSFSQMKDGVGPTIDGFRIKQDDAAKTPQAVIPVANLQTNVYSRAFFFIENLGSGKIKVWYFKKPSTANNIFQNPPTQLKEAGEVSIDEADFSGGAFAGVTYYDGMLYTVSYQNFDTATNTKRDGFGLNVFQIPIINKTTGEYEVSQKASDGFQHSVFKSNDYSYLDPALAVDAFKNIVIQFIRIPRSKSSVDKPQIRFKVKFSNKSEWENSVLVKKWDIDEEGNDRLVHYSWVTKDPFSLSQFWQAHIFKANGKTGTWIGRIDLGKF